MPSNGQPTLEMSAQSAPCSPATARAADLRKKQKNVGDQVQRGTRPLLTVCKKNAPESWGCSEDLLMSHFLAPTNAGLSLSDFQCKMCQCIADMPIETPCRKIACARCISELLREANLSAFECPCCEDCHTITTTSFLPASEFRLGIQGSLLLHCVKPACSAVVELKYLQEHLESGCRVNSTTFSSFTLTAQQILSHPIDCPPTILEQKVAASVIRRMLHSMGSGSESATSNVVRLPTEGTVSNRIIEVVLVMSVFLYSQSQ